MNGFFKNLFNSPSREKYLTPPPDTESLVTLIADIELKQKPEPGRKIHTFEYMDAELILDVEITEQYRLSVYIGREKKYGFIIKCNPGNYEVLKCGLEDALKFLNSTRKVSELPDNEHIKGYLFG